MTRHELLLLLQRHIGATRAVTVEQLVKEYNTEFAPKHTAARDVRSMVQELRLEGHHIAAHPSRGYFIAATPSELAETIQFLRARALASLAQISAMTRVSLPDLCGQSRFLLDTKGEHHERKTSQTSC
jgi:hypothetical protein